MAGRDSGGGSLSLAELIDEHGEKIYYDLHQYAGGLNLVHALDYESGYSPRQIIMLIRNLPIESATVAALRGDDTYRGWGLDRYMTATLIDKLSENNYIHRMANSGKGKKPQPPEAFYRPEDSDKKAQQQKPNSFATMAAMYFNAAQKKKEGV